mgnify:CR=1 FL=1
MANCGTKKMKVGGKVGKPMKAAKPKTKGVKIRGTGAATKGTMARGRMG